MKQNFTILFDLDGTLVDTAPDLMLAHITVYSVSHPTKNPMQLLTGSSLNWSTSCARGRLWKPANTDIDRVSIVAISCGAGGCASSLQSRVICLGTRSGPHHHGMLVDRLSLTPKQIVHRFSDETRVAAQFAPCRRSGVGAEKPPPLEHVGSS